jgi:propionyl-CoA synthetase
MIPKTRSGKTPRRCLRELVENGVQGKYDEKVCVPATVEDTTVVEVARGVVKEYLRRIRVKGRR